MEEDHPRRHDRDRSRHRHADVLIDGEKIAGVGSFDGVDAEVLDATGCFVHAGRDRQPHPSLDAVRRHDDRRRLRHGHAGRGRGRHDLPRRLRAADGAGGLRSSLEQWMGRAEGCAHVDYGFHMAITKADAGTFEDMAAMVDAGVSTFKVFLAYPNALMVTDDLFLAVLERSKETGGLVMVHAENGFAIDHLVKKSLAAGDTDPIFHALTRPEEFEAEATGRAIRLAEYADAPIYIVHVSCKRAVDEVIAARARGVRGLRRDLHPVPLRVDRRPAPARLRGRALRLLAAAARRRQPAAHVGRAQLRPPAVDLDRPLPVHRRAEAPRLRRLLEDPERPRRDPAPAAAALGARRQDRPHDAQPLRRGDLDGDREDLRPRTRARARSRPARTPTS